MAEKYQQPVGLTPGLLGPNSLKQILITMRQTMDLGTEVREFHSTLNFLCIMDSKGLSTFFLLQGIDLACSLRLFGTQFETIWNVG